MGVFRMLVNSVKNQIEKERHDKIVQRDRQKKMDRYHKQILNPNLPPIAAGDDGEEALSRTQSVRSFASLDALTEGTKKPFIRPLIHGAKPTKMISMSTQLGGKAKSFGEADIKKKKKKKKKIKAKKH